MARPIWTGSISFGMVNIPVKLFSAVSHKEVRFHMVHDADGARIKQKRVCSADGKEVPWEHIAKGYEVSSGQVVLIDSEELERLDPKATRSIDIEAFVNLAEIDPIFYESSYYLVPDRQATKAYALLVSAMKDSQRVGIARFVLRAKQYLAAVRVVGNLLMISTMLYADEIVPQSKLEGIPEKLPAPKEAELKMAEQLVESLSTRFEPEKYHDEYREKVLDLIKRKAKGERISLPRAPREPAKVVNLLDALKASLDQTRRPPKASFPAQPPRRAGARKNVQGGRKKSA
jgi:DNA end-binding protein Ku